MKLRSVNKLDKTKKTTSKTFDGDVISTNCGVIVIFPICGQFGAIWQPYSERIVCKSYISLPVILYLTKTENRTKKSLTQLSHYFLE